MVGGATYRGMYVYPWDLADEGFAAVTDAVRGLGCDTVTLATAYHAGKFLRPHGRTGRVAILEDGTIHFRHRPERYGRVQPARHSLLAEIDPLAELARTAPDLDRVAWVVACHNSRIGRQHPDLVASNCFGDPYPYSLCPAHPEVRDHVVALCRDLAEQHQLKAIAIETPGWLPYEHGWHHEFQLMRLDAWASTLLGLCFAPATLAAAAAAGIDAERLRRQAAEWLDGWLAEEIVLEPAAARDRLLADLVADPEWAAFLNWRCRLVAEFVAEIRASLPAGTELWVIPSVQRSSARGWSEGSDLAMLAEAADRLEICAYEPSAAAVRADIQDVRRRVGPKARLNAILRPSFPDLADGAETAAAARVLRAAGVEGLAFYNWGHLRRPALARVGDALAAWDQVP